VTRGIFIAGTDTGVGKTRITAALLRALREQGVQATGMKPVASGTEIIGDRIINEDVAMIAAESALDIDVRDINPYCFDLPASPHISAAKEGICIEIAPIVASFNRLTRGGRAVLVEGTGGWLAPISETDTMADIARALKLPVVLVVGLRLGCLNHALLTQQAIAAAGLALAGWIGSVLEPQMLALEQNIQTLDARLRAPRLALLPHAHARTEDHRHLAAAASALFTA
jgi:dethiobiotin synthetase